MKHGLIALSLLSVLGIASNSALAANGTIKFNGIISAIQCEMDNGGADIVVDMGKPGVNNFNGPGDLSDPHTFQIKLKNCPATATSATVSFDGKSYSGDTGVLALDDQAVPTDGAAGVGIQISDAKGTVVPLLTPSSDYALVTGNNTLEFSARYIQKAASVTAGIANATSQFTISYN
ncbi:type 1 fimbrial protein [Citrobacter farmeri]|uniref:fimbrial protein n=1 Tax=Citrobacter farmeri TaxID=67824 RepID=UPI001906D62A|nr:fimbrial protein [Citrobacter farmeri]EKV7299828.1 type 1 fimbrial protein [Citrobacter farmeri]MBJ8743067.1 type 1 fimbrial protein [Citrobacter farmeri]MBJ8757223.1 type 1 fimbrial protein [Citrobacter farmeri]MBJ9018664.1 type 1 fimbrial protein [Citrobacter farmeri]HCB2208467.1 type 1 fimbrial protein [Citrobacter farmeri]